MEKIDVDKMLKDLTKILHDAKMEGDFKTAQEVNRKIIKLVRDKVLNYDKDELRRLK